ncbi:MAG: TonB-dependent receptor [Paludibacter sp.]|nr:TonB-dependent receptor [Paludibacter sp.]
MKFTRKDKFLSNLASRTLVLSAFCIFSIGAFAQLKNVKLKGTVTDLNGVELVGVNVVGVGTTIGTITNIQGNWELTVPSTVTELKFSYIGYADKTSKIGTLLTINVKLEENTKEIDELVVIGYGSVKKSDLTGSVSSVKGANIARQPVANVAQALQGLVPGVKVTANSGSPGGSISVRIRGIGTVGDSDPLYVVDGMPVNDIAYLSTSEIESVEVLKDASATAIYGARGANGVIMITTKQGKSGIDVINISSYWGTSQINTDMKLLSGRQWYDIQTEINKTRTTPINLGGNADPSISTNWLKEVSRVAAIQNHDLSFSGGSENFTYNMSLGYLNQEGTLKKTDYERINARFNMERKMNKVITVGTNSAISTSSRNKILEGSNTVGIINSAIKLEPVVPVKNADGTWGASRYIDYPNPVAAIEFTNSNEKSLKFIGNIYAIVNIMKGLYFKSSLGVDYLRYDSYDFDPVYTVNTYQKNAISRVYRGYAKNNNVLFENTLNFNRTFNEKHNVGALLGYTAEQTRYENIYATKQGTPNNDPELQYLDAAQLATSATAVGGAYESSILSVLGRVNYNYDDRYLATASIRRDGSSRFGKLNQFGNFPSFAFAWKINNEPFFKNWEQEIFNSAKLRAGWGQVGNQSIANYAFQNLISSNAQFAYLFGKPEVVYQGAVAVALGNKNVKWEATESTNIGVDLGFFSNRLTVSAEYYDKITKDMLILEPIPLFLGYESGPTTNVGSARNSGIEIQTEWRAKIGKDFNYHLGGNISTIKNEMLSLGTSKFISGAAIRNGNATYTSVGNPIGSFWGYKTNGLVQTAEQLIDVKTRQPNAGLGDIVFVDNDKNGVLNDLDKTIIGKPLPDFYYGFNVGFEYKGIDFAAIFEGSHGNDIFNAMRFFTYDLADVTNKSVDVLNYWTPTNTKTTIPRLNGSDKNDNKRISDFYVEDGSYMRLKTLQIGYTIPQVITKKIFMSSLRVYVTGQNLLTFTKYTGTDPEIGQISSSNTLSRGVDIGTYPQAKTFTAGINITF